MSQTLIYPNTWAVTPPKASDGPPETEVPLLQLIAYLLQSGAGGGGGGGGFIVVNGQTFAYDSQAFTYIGLTNNIATITYRTGGSSGAIVAVQRFAYAGAGSANDDLVTLINTTST